MTDEYTEVEEVEEVDREQMKQAALVKCADWFQADRNAKKDIMDELDDMLRLYNGKHWDLTGPGGQVLRTDEQKKSRPNTVENIVFALIEGLVAEFSEQMDIIDYPVEQGDDEAAAVLTDLKEFIAYKNRLQVEREKWLRWFFLYGTAIWHIYWDPHWRGGRGPNRWVGDIRWKALHPQAVFPDARCRDSIEDGRRVHKAFYKTQEEIREKWNVEVPAESLSTEMFVGDDYNDDFYSGDADENQALVVETWYKGDPLILDEDEENHGPGLHVIWWAGEAGQHYLKHSNYVYYDPHEDARFPFIFRHRYPRENSIWGYGEAHFLKDPQIARNKSAELILEAHTHEVLGQTFYERGTFDNSTLALIKKFGTLAGMWWPVKRIEGIKKVFGRGAPASLQNEPGRLDKTMETIVGRFDVSQGRAPGSVTAFRALDLLAARAQVRLRTAETNMITAHEDAGNMINNLIYKLYTEKRAYRILGDEIGQGDAQDRRKAPKYGMFDGDKLRKVYVFSSNEVLNYSEWEQGAMMQEGLDDPALESQAPVEGEDYEIYYPAMDVMCKVSTSMPTDRAFYMEMAKELYSADRIDAEVFWHVLQHGKFPPYEELMERERMKAEMQAPPTPQGGVQGEVTPEQMAQIEQLLDANPELRAEFEQASPEQQEAVIMNLVQQL